MEKIKKALSNFNATNSIPVSEMNKITGGLNASTPDTCSSCRPDDCEIEGAESY